MYLEKLHRKMISDGYTLYPASDDIIGFLIKKYGNLPGAYLEFLKILGAGTNGNYLRGESCFVDELLYLNDWGRELLLENCSKHRLSDDDFVFLMSQGCMFCFFNLNEGDNPPVYFYTEIKPNRIKKVSGTLSDFLWQFYINPGNVLV